jgi:hypothetical protein
VVYTTQYGGDGKVSLSFLLIPTSKNTISDGPLWGSMALSDYTGRTPRETGEVGEVRRVSRHTQWTVGDTARSDCASCDNQIDLGERHVLVTLSVDGNADSSRRHLCDETCLEDWLDGE